MSLLNSISCLDSLGKHYVQSSMSNLKVAFYAGPDSSISLPEPLPLLRTTLSCISPCRPACMDYTGGASHFLLDSAKWGAPIRKQKEREEWGWGSLTPSLWGHLKPVVPTTKGQGSSQGDHLYQTVYYLSDPREGIVLLPLTRLLHYLLCFLTFLQHLYK